MFYVLFRDNRNPKGGTFKAISSYSYSHSHMHRHIAQQRNKNALCRTLWAIKKRGRKIHRLSSLRLAVRDVCTWRPYDHALSNLSIFLLSAEPSKTAET